jgi:hypothetical protein
MTPPDLGVAQGKRRHNGTKIPHQFKGTDDRYPDNAQKYVCTGQTNHCRQQTTRYPDKYLIQVVGYFVQKSHIIPQCSYIAYRQYASVPRL